MPFGALLAFVAPKGDRYPELARLRAAIWVAGTLLLQQRCEIRYRI